jgi:hypothetical protein
MLKKLSQGSNRSSLLIASLISVLILCIHFSLPRYTYNGFTREMDWDILSYYLYLPLVFLHNDLGIKDYSYVQHLFDQYHFSPTFYQASQAENGNYVMMYTMGLAMLESPFFFIGHLWAKIGGYPTDGFSFPYQFCVSTGMMLYLLAGIFLLRKILLRFFPDRTVCIALILLVLGTNYFRELTDYNLGPHAVLFSLYCVLIYYTIKWHEEQRIKYAVVIGFAIGFLTLSRPTELICVMIPLFWNVYNRESLQQKLSLVKNNGKQLLVLAGCVILVGIPQMIYWKILTGSWIYNSYWNQQSFDIHESHLMKILFSFRKGWFVYSPLIIIAFAGFFLLGKEKLRQSQPAVYIFIALNLFLISHVPIWWNAGSFGQRFMVQSYAVLAIPFTAFIHFLLSKKFLIRAAFGAAGLLLVLLNLFQTWQFVHWILPGDGITKEFYFATFLRTKDLTEKETALLEMQRSFDPGQQFVNDGSYQGRSIGYFNMDDVNTGYVESYPLDTAFAHSGKYAFRLNPEAIYSPTLKIPYSAITKKDHAWIRFTVWYYPTSPIRECSADIVIHFTHNEKSYSYAGYHLADHSCELNTWNKLSVDYLTPSPFGNEDEMSAYVWFTGTKPLYIDDIHVEAFEKK